METLQPQVEGESDLTQQPHSTIPCCFSSTVTISTSKVFLPTPFAFSENDRVIRLIYVMVREGPRKAQ